MTYIPMAVCVPCGVEMRPKKNDFVVRTNVKGDPYYDIYGDLYECPKCGVQIVTGFASTPSVFHHERRFSYHEFHLIAEIGS